MSVLHWAIHQFVPGGFRDEGGVWHDGLHRVRALAELDALVAERDRLAKQVETLRAALAAIKTNAESWHGVPNLDDGHFKALAVIASWSAAALAATEEQTE